MGTNLDMDGLNNAMASTSLTEKGTATELLFKPCPGTEADGALDNIPRYLFRVFAPSSDAGTDGIWVHSKSVRQGLSSSTKDIFSFRDSADRQEIAYQLNMHLRWWGNADVENNFVSWTSSLLFAIQYIYYRRYKDHDNPSFSDMNLCVIDTSEFPRGTFMCDLDLMRSFGEYDYPSHPDYRPSHYNLANLRNLRTRHPGGYYFGEFLSQGSLRIQNNFQMIPANLLFENDRLRRLNLDFDNLYSPEYDNIKWAAAVVELRKSIWPSTLPRLSSAVMESRLQAVKEIVDNVAPGWRFPLAIYLAALIGCESTTDEQGTANDNIFFQFFRLGTWDGQAHVGFQPFHFEVIAPDTMPELQQVRKLVRETHKHFQLTQALDDLREAEVLIRHLNVKNVFSENGVAAFAVKDSNQGLERVGLKVQTKLRAVQGLCGKVASAYATNLA